MKFKLLFIFYSFSFNLFSQGTWTAKANLLGTARLTAVAFTIGNKGYFGTGSIGFGNSVSDFWEYNPATNSWAQKANFGGGARGFACGFSIGTKGYIGTGLNNTTYYNDFWEYDPATNLWTQKASCGATLRWAAGSFAVNGKGYIVAGHNQSYVAQGDVWQYDPVGNLWTQKSNFAGAVRGDIDRAPFVLSGKAYLGTGANIASTPMTDYNDFWQYDPVTDTWTQEANFPGTKRHGATGFSVCNMGYLGLGQDGNVNSFNDFWQYDAGTNSWNTVAAFGGNARGDAAPFVIGSKAYVCGGSSGSSPFVMYKDLWEFTPSGVLSLTVTATNTVICSSTSVTLNVSGGSSYLWSTGSTATSIVVTPTTSTTYTVSDPGNPCSVGGIISVAVISQPPVTISGNSSVCSGDSIILSASGGGNYLWTTGATTPFIIIAPSATTTYSVIASAASCADTSAFTVSVSPYPIATVLCVDTICSGQNAILSANGGGTYSWNTGFTSSAIIISPSANTTYSVVVSLSGCDDTTLCTVNVVPSPTVIISSDITISSGASTTLVASGGGGYSWSTGAATDSIFVSPVTTTPFCVVVTSSNNCSDTACVTVTVEPIDCSASSVGKFYFPNAFSPNGDNENETFGLYIGNYNCIKEYKFSIYNRWGEKVFETDKPTDSWDGIYRGTMEGSALFVYYAKAVLTNGDEIVKSGNVSLIK